MSNPFKKAACFTLTAVMTLSCANAFACTGYYVGKEASASGHTIIGHTVDAWNTAQAKQVVYPHSEEPGRTVTVGANEVPLPDVTYQQVQERDLKVMDASAITICRENKVPCIRVFGLDDPQNILRVIEGDMMGTVVHP